MDILGAPPFQTLLDLRGWACLRRPAVSKTGHSWCSSLKMWPVFETASLRTSNVARRECQKTSLRSAAVEAGPWIRRALHSNCCPRIRAWRFYAHCVFLYTQRELYQPFDILSAFSGMCKLMESVMHSPFIFGLPTSHFDFVLLWQPTKWSSRSDKPKHLDEQKYKDMKFPSWSWCGWESNGIKYMSEMVEGCLTDIHAWLVDHTWIDWHIRDGHDTLRRVWDETWAEEDQSLKATWKCHRVRRNETLKNKNLEGAGLRDDNSVSEPGHL